MAALATGPDRFTADQAARAAWRDWAEGTKNAADARRTRVREHIATASAAGDEWDVATGILDGLDALPDSHARALQRLAAGPGAYGPWPTVEIMRVALGPRPAPHHSVLPAPGTWADLAVLAAAVEAITPPPSECGPEGMALARGLEEDIREAADRAARDAADEINTFNAAAWRRWEKARAAALAAGQPAPPAPAPRDAQNDTEWSLNERTCPIWQRRRLRRESRRALSWFDAALRMAGPLSPAVSGYALAGCRTTWERGRAWAAGTTVAFEDGTMVPLDELQRRGRAARRAQMYAIARAMEHHAGGRDYLAFFVTLTLPGEYHPFVAGERAADGTYPDARSNPAWNRKYGPKSQWTELQRRWALLRARLAKYRGLRDYWGISVPEPHQDGTPHLHIMMWLPRTIEDTRQGTGEGGTPRAPRQTAHVLRDIVRGIAPDRQGRIEIVRKRPDRVRPDGSVQRFSTPATYVMKYVMLSLDDEATQGERGESAERHRAWASTRGLRRMRLVGCHGSLRVWQRIWASPDDEELPRRASEARAAMRRSKNAGEAAAALEARADPDEAAWTKVRDLRRSQAAAAAEALVIIGGLPGGNGRLTLEYEDAETGYGRPSRQAVAVVEGVCREVEVTEDYVTPVRGIRRTKTRRVTQWVRTGDVFPLRRQECTLVPTGVTVEASYPRVGAPETDPTDLLVADSTEALIRERECLPQWDEWCADMREYAAWLRSAPSKRSEIWQSRAA